ncbi:MAG: hypothetical protein ACOC0N_01400 [Chroococcales cyanobacterium]
MLHFLKTNFKPPVSRTGKLIPISRQLLNTLAPKSLSSVGLVTVLGLTAVNWITTSAIAPQVAQAYTARETVTLTRLPNESFETMVRRAEVIARAAAQRMFNEDILMTEVAITILGQNDGQIAPILQLDVSRQSWQNLPDPQQWATYFPISQDLLDFRNLVGGSERPTQPSPTQPPQQAPTNVSPQPGEQTELDQLEEEDVEDIQEDEVNEGVIEENE